MTRRVVGSVLVAFALTLTWSSTALGQDDGEMTFGAEETESAEPQAPYQEFIAEGKKLYEKGKFAEASLMFHKVVSAQMDDPGAESFVPEAEYELGKTLFRMELYQGALAYFGQIVDQGEPHPYFEQTLRPLVLLTDVIPGDPSLLERLAAYYNPETFPQKVPEKYRDRYAYLVGRHFYQNLNTDNALELLGYVSRRSDLFAKSRYIAAITNVANYEAAPAVQNFKEVLRYLNDKKGGEGLNEQEKNLLELSNLGMARVFYSTGDYETSLKYYSNVDRESDRWPQALFESSWAYFQVDGYNRALGNLHSLNSPFFADAYFPEGPILAAVIFFYNCKYDRVEYELGEFEYYYEPLKPEVQTVLDTYQDPTEMFEFLRELKEGETDFDPQVYQILNAALDDAQVKRKFELVETVRAELEKIESMPSSWKQSSLGGTLVQDATVAESFALNDAGSLAQQRLERVVTELDDLIRQKSEIKFEVTRARRGQVQADIRAGMDVAANTTQEERIEVSDEQMYWTFDGEYWKDELGHYVFAINSQCKR
ncbi:MAG: tetratricopeptide repeat protein [Myxococcota bacterium]